MNRSILRPALNPFISLILFSLSLGAQNVVFDYDVRFKKTSIEQGLSQSTISCIIQDSRDFLWFGTQDGLNQYNGYKFKVFKHDFLDSTSISSSHINCILEGRMGKVWVGTDNGLNVFDPMTGTFESFKNNPQDPKTICSNNVTCLYQDRTNTIWVGTGDNGLCRFNVESKQVVGNYFKNERYNKTTISSNNVTAICEDKNGQIWVGTVDGLSVYDRKRDRFKVYRADPSDPNSLADNNVNCLVEGLNGYIFIGTDNGLSVFNPETERITNYRGVSNGLGLNAVSALFEDRSGKLWIGTDGEGVCVFDQYNKSFRCFDYDDEDHSGLSNPFIWSIYEDKSGTIWIGTWGGGLNSYNPHFSKFSVLQKKHGDDDALSSNDISSVCEDYTGTVWIGTYGYGLNKYNIVTGENEVLLAGNSSNSISSNSIQFLYEDSVNNVVWVGTQGGLDAVDITTGKVKHYRHDPKDETSISGSDIRSIYKDRSGVIWVATTNGLNAFYYQQGKFRRYYFKSGKSATGGYNDIISVCEDLDGMIWAGTNGSGLRKLNPTTGEIKVYQFSENNKKSLSNNVVNQVYEDALGVLWVSTSNGLNAYRPDSDSFEYYTEHDGLPNNVVYGVVEDKHNKLWLATNNGICSFLSPITQKIMSLQNENDEAVIDGVVEVTNPLIKTYDIKDGLPSNEFNQGAIAKGKNGRLHFGTISGLLTFNPDSLRINPYIAPVYITSFKVDGKEHLMDSTILFKKIIELDYDQNDFSFEFITLNFISSEKNEYAFYLESVDDDWRFVGGRNFVNYTNVDPGTYTFSVRAGNNDGIWNEDGAYVTIIIHPPFWRTNLFYFICFLVIVGLVILYIKWRERSLTVQKKILEKKVAERTRQLKREKDRVEIAYLQIDSKNKEITDSIKYAKRLQEAILTPEDEIQKHLPESFILYKPKDIVSGDFYYFNIAHNDELLISAVDCTGHGVPGAFMSIVGNNLLNQSINVNGKVKPAEILDEVNTGLSETLRQTLTEASVKDGMDMALCAVNTKTRTVQYAGAYNPIWFVKKGIVDSDIVLDERAYPIDKDLIEIRADKFPVGKFLDNEDHKFTNHEFSLQKGDTFYIFSDGYADQFGGIKGKKFKYKRMRDLLISIQDKSMAEQKQILERRIENWKGELEQVDDILIIGVRMT